MTLSGRRPPPQLIALYRDAMLRLLQTWGDVERAVGPVEITSWWRSPSTNRQTRGAATHSQHLFGAAMDGKVRGMTRAQLLPHVQRYAARHGVSAPTAPSEASGTTVHVQSLPVGTVQRVIARDPAFFSRLGIA